MGERIYNYFCYSIPQLEGQVTVTFINGTAEFTRMRVDRPASGLQLLFITTPGSYRAHTSVLFTVIDPPSDTTRQEVIFILEGDTSVLTNLSVDTVRDAIQTALSLQLDIDISRIQDITYNITVSTSYYEVINTVLCGWVSIIYLFIHQSTLHVVFNFRDNEFFYILYMFILFIHLEFYRGSTQCYYITTYVY